ncbi:leucine--tRNA ligase [Candidatus Daviesbacteria bacterium RIFCSPHIGHO2_12_FULL_37_11]|uniref:Leucine--tRNA ligase n=1 Tax=Candidatus Daviesbacteria bacterium RIFCSPHIGHO2_12_FULL_37_11 TaxID=1797777 RepID=A0A1F5KDC5_9BACT|nr:MAG: leucine--tRNA ligase [Candidatus Daviesbacteria bacterium RIFCSPHIGHO2_12_FULL_37_11]
MKKYNPSQIESKWQKKWRKDKLYNPDMDRAGKPYYVLMMFPYPSAEGLHVGNMYPFTGTDIYSRFKRMQGFDVFEPIGLDGFGIHSENYALKVNEHPFEVSKRTEKRFYAQLTAIGNAFDWTRTVETYKSNYYKWTQWLFLQMYKKGLVYKKKASVNWCPADRTVLADEQVISGICERCGAAVEKKELEQWFFKITDYADRLLNNLDHIDWSEKIKIAQRNWIGRKEGINITYKVEGNPEKITVFTTRPDTNYGATFIVIAPEYPQALSFIKPENLEDTKQYIKVSKNKSSKDRIAEGREKTGVFTGSYALNELTGYKMSIWISDFVLMEFGTGAVVGVPGHDKRDFEFAQKFSLEVKRVVVGRDGDSSKITKVEQVQEEEGTMVNSEFLNGLDIHEATVKIMDFMEEKGWGKRVTTYHLRDWLISRQRYWGPPIPIIYCEKCGTVPVAEENLPVELPYIKDFRPKGTGKSPLASDDNFVNTKCPKCSGSAKRETDVSDTFLDSAWYFLRYPSTEFDNKPFDDSRTKSWLPVDMYIGGAEHSVLHLLYARFVTMVLKDMGKINFEEPFEKFRAHGLIIKEGAKMSKSKGNVINPDEYIKRYGSDTLRVYLMFMGPFSEGGDFRDASIGGIFRFLNRVWQMTDLADDAEQTGEELKIAHKTIKKVGNDIENLRFNTAISSLMEFLNFIFKQKRASKMTVKILLLLLAPFAPHITEEMWLSIREKYSIHKQSWPKIDSKYLEEVQINVVIQVNGKVRDTILIEKDMKSNKEIVEKLALESENLKKFINKTKPKKVIYIPGKIINFVI